MSTQLYWIDRQADRKSRRIAAGMTSGLVAGACLGALIIFTHVPPTLTVPKGNAPLTMTVRHIPPPPPAQKQDMHRLLSDVPTEFTVPVPPPLPDVAPVPLALPQPVQEQAKPEPRPQPKPQPKPQRVPAAQPQAPAAVERADQTGVFGHETGVREAKPDRSAEIMVALLHAIDARKKYPKQARRLGLQGEVMMRVTIDGSGRVTRCAVNAQNTGGILEKAADELAKSLLGVDILPARGGGTVEITVPVRYSMK